MENAIQILQHYFRTAFEKQGLKWDSDSNAEIRSAVESIIEEARMTDDEFESACVRYGLIKR